MTAELYELWVVQPFQHGRADPGEGGQGYETEKEAMAAARQWASEVPFDFDTEHECVVFKAVASYRGRLTPVKHDVKSTKE